jgi:hypothetical protein
MTVGRFPALIVAALSICAVGNVLAQPAPTEVRSRCYDCHLNPNPPEGTQLGPHVDLSTYQGSEHGQARCESCHRDVVDIPHEAHLAPVDCTECHRSGTPSGAPQLRSYREFEESVHGLLVAAGDPRAPRCQTCHGDHDVLRGGDEASHVHKFHLAETCGNCHVEIAALYRDSSHGQGLARGNLMAPVCTDCHGEHFIHRPDEPVSTVAKGHVVETCSQCHQDIQRMQTAGIPTSVVETYEDSYHGVAAKFGSTQTATCIDCHGHHRVRGPSDPLSRVHETNLPTTCGQTNCHPGAGPGFAKGKVHADFHHAQTEPEFIEGRDRSAAKVFKVVELAFIALTTSVIFGMILYMALDLYHRWVREAGKRVRYVAVTAVPLLTTFWVVWRVVLVFIDKLRS